MNFADLSTNTQEIIFILLVVAAAYLLGRIVHWIIFRSIRWSSKKYDNFTLQSVHKNLRRPASYAIPLLFTVVLLPLTNEFFEVTQGKIDTAQLLLEICLYIAVAWVIIECIDVISDVVVKAYNLEEIDNLEERKIITQMQFIKRMTAVVVTVLAIAIILFQFESVREVGTGLLTSAGVAGIIIGLAAQKSIANLLAGFQIAFTQPIRIDDVVILEGEFGRVEEITLTYVVVRVWDQRRLVVPLNRFIDQTFQNWTRSNSELLGTIYIYTDYRMPVQAIRDELTKILEGTELWDQRVNGVMVTNATERVMEIRALVSARDAGQAFDLRCLVRERLITFIQKNYPDCLPRTRVEMNQLAEEDGQNGQEQRAEVEQG